MSGALVGAAFGLGLLLVSGAGARSRRGPSPVRLHLRASLADLLAEAGMNAVRPGQLIGACAIATAAVATSVVVTTGSTSLGLAFGALTGYAPIGFVRRRRDQRAAGLREQWPDVVDNLASAVRAGLSLPEAVAQVGVRGPEALRESFVRFGKDYRASGRFGECLDRLKDDLADPVADRIIEALRLAREVGGSDLGRLLRTLSQFLREDARTRAELETRQGWTVNAARLALAAPWVVLGLLALRPETVAAYDTALGVVVLGVGGTVSFVAYRVMIRIGRLPRDERVLR